MLLARQRTRAKALRIDDGAALRQLALLGGLILLVLLRYIPGS